MQKQNENYLNHVIESIEAIIMKSATHMNIFMPYIL